MRSTLNRIALALVVVAAAAIVAVPAFGRAQHRSAVNIKVYAKEFAFTLPLKFAPHGVVQFTVVNKGKLPHDFKIAGKKTPLISPGKSARIKVSLKKGKYSYICTVAGHAKLGMRGSFTAK